MFFGKPGQKSIHDRLDELEQRPGYYFGNAVERGVQEITVYVVKFNDEEKETYWRFRTPVSVALTPLDMENFSWDEATAKQKSIEIVEASLKQEKKVVKRRKKTLKRKKKQLDKLFGFM